MQDMAIAESKVLLLCSSDTAPYITHQRTARYNTVLCRNRHRFRQSMYAKPKAEIAE